MSDEPSKALEPNGQKTVHVVGQGDNAVAVFEFDGEHRQKMLEYLHSGYLSTGRYTSDSRALAPQTVLSMVTTGAAVSGTMASAAFSNTLYMATAAPSSLMQIGGGVGSAVMGANGIVAQAPFIAVASSLPVVAPLMAMQALNAAFMMQQFKNVDQKLDGIKRQLDELVRRQETDVVAELLSASTIADEVYRQYQDAGQFSVDMLTRLALAERDVRRVALRSRMIVDGHTVESLMKSKDSNAVHQANVDSQNAMLASFLELRIAYLRLCVDMQENPKAVPGSVKELAHKLEDGAQLWKRLRNRSKAFLDEKERLEAAQSDKNVVQRKLFTEKDIAALQSAYTDTLASEKKISEGFDSLIENATDALDSIKSQSRTQTSPCTLVYWEDEAGPHSLYTDELQIRVSPNDS